jgi:hypothetical protein
LLVQPDTFLMWHRQGFLLFWKQKSKTTLAKVSAETIALMKEMARNNRLYAWFILHHRNLHNITKTQPTLNQNVPPLMIQGKRFSAFLRSHSTKYRTMRKESHTCILLFFNDVTSPFS